MIPAAIVLLSLAGAGVSAYLLSFRLMEQPVVCFTGSGCAEVNASPFAELFGIPVSALGLLLYLMLGALALLWRVRATNTPESVRLTVFALALTGFLFSAYLTWVEAFVLHAYCSWCLISFGIITVILALASTGVLRPVSGESR